MRHKGTTHQWNENVLTWKLNKPKNDGHLNEIVLKHRQQYKLQLLFHLASCNVYTLHTLSSTKIKPVSCLSCFWTVFKFIMKEAFHEKANFHSHRILPKTITLYLSCPVPYKGWGGTGHVLRTTSNDTRSLHHPPYQLASPTPVAILYFSRIVTSITLIWMTHLWLWYKQTICKKN